VIHDARTQKYVDIVAEPVIHVKGNMVSITCATPGTRVYYTTNGVTPSFVDENEFTKPFNIKKGTTIKAIAKKYGVDNSRMVIFAKN